MIGDLNLVRCLARVGVPVTLASWRAEHTNGLSRHCAARLRLPDPTHDPEGAVATLLAHALGCASRPVLFYTGDPDLLLVSRARHRLARAYDFVIAEGALVEALVDKVRFHALAERLGLPTPPTLPLPPGSDRAAAIAAWAHYPCVLKPACRRIGWEGSPLLRAYGRPAKVIGIADPAEWRPLLPHVAAHREPLLLQAAIPGDETRIVSYHAYFTVAGEAVAEFTGRKVRTFPREWGHSTCVEITDHRDLRALGRAIATRLGLRGVVKLDFKEHPLTGQRFLLEVNPRFNLWHWPAAVAGVNLPALVYRDLTGAAMPAPRPLRRGVRWLSFLDDLNAFRDYRRSGDLTLPAWLASLARCRAWEGFAWDDPLPAAVAFGRFVLRTGRRLLQRKAPPLPIRDAMATPR